jgi:hypothetical protein
MGVQKFLKATLMGVQKLLITVLTLFHAVVYGMHTMRHEGRKAQTKLGCLDLCRLERIPILTAVGQ